MNVVFANMPFARTVVPSLALATFLPILRNKGFSCEVLYQNLRLSARLGRRRYDEIAHQQSRPGMMLGELLFAQVLNGTDYSRELEVLAREVGGRSCASAVEGLRAALEDFVRETAAEILALEPTVVGFSSIFQQQMAILACAQQLRRQGFTGFILLGGANCEGPMGQQTARSFESLDFVVSGPGERVLPELLESLLNDAPPGPLAGVFPTARQSRWPRHAGTFAEEGPLDDLPFPDFGGYFQAAASVDHPAPKEVLLPFEGSRGCWWGAKHHCTFCGLNGQNMAMRSKSPPRALAELRHLARQWPDATLMPVDNIMPLSFLRDLLPALAADPVGSLFYEVKANLRFDQLELLKRANVVELQPGIESLSDATLRRMRKGVDALQNIQLLRDSKRLALNLRWNLLYGFPGEEEHEYDTQLDIIPLLAHLQPPIGAGRVELDRFSPMFERPEAFGIQHVRPLDAYGLMYPALAESELMTIAYYFDGSYRERTAFAPQQRRLQLAVTRWQDEHRSSFLAMVNDGAGTVLVDTRPRARQRITRLSATEAAVLDHAQTPARPDCVSGALGVDSDAGVCQQALDDLLAIGALVKINGRVLSLVEDTVDPERLEAALAFRRLQYG